MSTMQLTYFPYLMLRDVEEIIQGNVKVWNFKKKSTEYIPDETLSTQPQKKDSELRASLIVSRKREARKTAKL